MALLRSTPPIRCLGTFALLLAFGQPLNADSGCPAVMPPPAMSAPTAVPETPLFIKADRIRAIGGGISEFIGGVTLSRGGEQLTADYLRYSESERQAHATGNVTLTDPTGVRVDTPELQLKLDTRVGTSGPATYTLGPTLGHGQVQRIDFEGPNRTRLSQARYTTCPTGHDDWFIKVRTLTLDSEKDIGVARNVTVEFLGLPVFYLPYLSFPISDKRQSGFLTPQFGYKTELGAIIAAPYYFNLAPQYDDTLTPRVLGKRGVQLQNQFRYLTPRSQGRLELEYLANDNVTGEARAAGAVLHRHVWNPRWNANVDLRGVSDKNYLTDFGDHLGITSQTHLPQNAEVNFAGRIWNFTARAADYQTVDRTIAALDRPYARVPQLLLSARPPRRPDALQFGFDAEAVQFERDAGVTGRRVNLNPTVAWPLARPYGFITPAIHLWHIDYRLVDANPNPKAPSTSTAGGSLDSGLIFERDMSVGARKFTQTLEPRLFYAYIPNKFQDDQPNFDTTLPDFSFANLFRINRFVGGDRVGDANQLTAAVTTRFLDQQDGIERGTLSFGQIYYFADRTVNLPAGALTDNSSPLVAEASAWLVGNIHARGGVQWDPRRDETQKSSLYFQYQPAANKIINLGHRFTRNELEQIDISTEWPLGGRWMARARSLYSSRDRQNIERYVGLEYKACCWAMRVHAARRLAQTSATASGTEQTRTIMLEIELTGLSKLGSSPESPLRQGLFSFPAAHVGAPPAP